MEKHIHTNCNAVMNFWYSPYGNHTSVLNSYITNILLFLSIITPEQTFEVRVQLIHSGYLYA